MEPRPFSIPSAIQELAASLAAALRPEIDVFSDEWAILDWVKRPGNLTTLTLRFGRLKNLDLKSVAKVYIAAKRVQIGISDGGAFAIIEALARLDLLIGDKPIQELNLLDFMAVENTFIERGIVGKVSSLSNLQGFAKWLQMRLGLRILYVAPKNGPAYGRHGTEEGRQKKLLPTEVLRDIVALVNFPELSLRDKFFINALVINIALGGRINELACLPLDCLIKLQGKWVIKVFPEKGGKLLYRPFPQEMYPAVKAAVDFIAEHTTEGRQIVKTLRLTPGLDWKKVARSEQALRYFSKKFASEWLKEHSLFTPRGSYYSTTGQFVDAIGLLERFKKPSKAAAYLGTTTRVFVKLVSNQKAMSQKIYLYEKKWDELAQLTCEVKNWQRKLWKHPHSVNVKCMERHWEVTASASRWVRNIVGAIFEEAAAFQLQDKPYPFEIDLEYEKSFYRSILPTIRASSDALLEPEDSLFVISRNLLTYSNKKRSNEFTKVSDKAFISWLGTTDKAGALFQRFNILDPRTGSVADFTWHDIRHWLNTAYKQGGLSDSQVNIILGRAEYSQAQVYDHTSALTRSLMLQEMMQRVREDKTIGLIQTTFNKLMIDDRKSAEDYLTAAIRVINPMPHGGCAHNLALKPCQHHLSCLAKGTNGKPCEMLIVDAHNDKQKSEIQRIAHDADSIRVHILNVGGESSPQFKHFQSVQDSANFLLTEIFQKKP
jgi:hypothetical protein